MLDWLLRLLRTPELAKIGLPIAPRWIRPTEGGFVNLDEDMIRFMQEESKCPYCKSQLYEGPSGGINVNVFCGNPDCNSRFNITKIIGLPMGEFTGTCPDDFIDRRRAEIAAEKTAKILGNEI